MPPPTVENQKTTILTSIPAVESPLLALTTWYPNVLVRCGYAQVALPPALVEAMPNALIRLYSVGESGLRVEVGRGRVNGRGGVLGKYPIAPVTGVNVGTIQCAQPVIATRVPNGGKSLQLTWVWDNFTFPASTPVFAQFEMTAWGDGASPAANDDAIPAESTAQRLFSAASSQPVAPHFTYPNGEPHDSFLIEGIFTNLDPVNDVWVYFTDAGGLSRTAAILVAAGATASYTPRRPIYFTTAMTLVCRNSPSGPTTGAAAPVNAQLTWA